MLHCALFANSILLIPLERTHARTHLHPPTHTLTFTRTRACTQVGAEAFAHMTKMLMGLADGRVMLALEGGYHLPSLSACATACLRTLLGESPPPLSPSTTATLRPNDKPNLPQVSVCACVCVCVCVSILLSLFSPVGKGATTCLPFLRAPQRACAHCLESLPRPSPLNNRNSQAKRQAQPPTGVCVCACVRVCSCVSGVSSLSLLFCFQRMYGP